MSVNIKELFTKSLPGWIAKHLSDGAGAVDEKFWIVPVHPEDATYADLVETAAGVLKSTRLLETLDHESLVFILLNDVDGRKLCIGEKELSVAGWDLALEADEFSEASLNFLQRAHLVTKYGFAPRGAIPFALVKDSPVYEDDLLAYFPELCVLKLEESLLADNFRIVCLKALIALEGSNSLVRSLRDGILNVGYAIPIDSHEWIFGQLFSAVRSRRLSNFYLEIYKLFEFFFPIDSIFKLADQLGYNKSELELLEYCRGALSWNVNHQRGARAAAGYATTDFAEICLGEKFVLDVADMTEAAKEAKATNFKGRAIEKLTATRHVLTHQDFRPAFVPEAELLRYTEGMLLFLRDAFVEYSSRLAGRRKRSQVGRRHGRAQAAVAGVPR